MLKPVVTRGLMLDFIPDEIFFDAKINPKRIFKLNQKDILKGEIKYLMRREFRLKDNWGLIYTKELAETLNRNFSVLILINESKHSKKQLEFLEEELEKLEKDLAENHINYKIIKEFSQKTGESGAIVTDFDPLGEEDFEKFECAVFEVDSRNIIPCKVVSDKQEFSAATLRRKVYGCISEFLRDFESPFKTTEKSCDEKLKNFIENKLSNYSQDKNNPNKDAVSNLSACLHFGLISSQRLAIEVIKSNVSRENKEVFLEELIVRRELSDNFCFYNKNYKSIKAAPDWALETLEAHKSDIRTYNYDYQTFKDAKTHDELWNAAQKELLKKGKIHGYMRMYWAKKILEWSSNPETALEIAIKLNDEFALDGNETNGYVGILWSIAGVHDRAFSARPVVGKIRYMSFLGCKNKFDTDKYIKSN